MVKQLDIVHWHSCEIALSSAESSMFLSNPCLSVIDDDVISLLHSRQSVTRSSGYSSFYI